MWDRASGMGVVSTREGRNRMHRSDQIERFGGTERAEWERQARGREGTECIRSDQVERLGGTEGADGNRNGQR
jgi:hypothetical protein